MLQIKVRSHSYAFPTQGTDGDDGDLWQAVFWAGDGGRECSPRRLQDGPCSHVGPSDAGARSRRLLPPLHGTLCTGKFSYGNQVSRLWEKGTRQHLPQLQFITTTELESVATMCFRSFDGANYETRKAIAKTLGNILAMTQQMVR